MQHLFELKMQTICNLSFFWKLGFNIGTLNFFLNFTFLLINCFSNIISKTTKTLPEIINAPSLYDTLSESERNFHNTVFVHYAKNVFSSYQSPIKIYLSKITYYIWKKCQCDNKTIISTNFTDYEGNIFLNYCVTLGSMVILQFNI